MALGVTGGLGLFLFGMFFLNDSLQKIAGQKLRETLITLTGSPWRGMSTGLFTTLLNQSSSATTLLEVSLVGAGLMTFYQSMAVTMGAEIGSTVTAQLVAFKLTDFAVVIAGLGFFISFFAKNKKTKNIGDMIIGFGILFLGMKIMSDLMVPIRNYGPFMEVMEKIENPWFGILVGLVFTALIHSSGAATGIVIALALAGVISLEQAIPLNLGAQIGTCATAVLGAIGRGNEGKRVALWHVFHQTAGVLLVIPFVTVVSYAGEPAWMHFITWFSATFFNAQDVARQIAMSHTLISIFNTMIFFPLLPLARNLMISIIPEREEEKPFGPKYIDEAFLATPELALEQARKEVVREGENVLGMMKEALRIFDTRDIRLSEAVALKEIRTDILRNAVVPYLSRIAQGYLSEEHSPLQAKLLYIASEIENIGDIIDKNILPMAHKKIENKLWFSDEGWNDIVELHTQVTLNLEECISALTTNNLELARLVAERKPELNRFETELRKRHIERLNTGLKEALETSSIHLDLIDQFKRINSHVSSICFTLLGQLR
jgi:phosphate:Na+ symporter